MQGFFGPQPDRREVALVEKWAGYRQAEADFALAGTKIDRLPRGDAERQRIGDAAVARREQAEGEIFALHEGVNGVENGRAVVSFMDIVAPRYWRAAESSGEGRDPAQVESDAFQMILRDLSKNLTRDPRIR